jgi:hypothetical protein
MNRWKWILLICTVVLSILPAAIEYRNSKHGDKRAKIYWRITGSLLVIWILSCLGIALAMYKDFSRKEKSPEFTAYLNGNRIEKNSCVTILETNDSKDLVFMIVNNGDWPADSLRLAAFFPKAMNVTPSGTWQRIGVLNQENSGSLPDGNAFTVKSDVSDVLGTPDSATFVPLTVQTTNLNNSVNLCGLRVYAKNATDVTIPFQIHFLYGNLPGKN